MKVAIENVPELYPFVMKSVEDFTKFYNEVNGDIDLVLDVGHANLNGQVELFLTTFTNKIVHMHLSDNDGKSDQHLSIGHGVINWKKVADLIENTSYDKVVIVESVENVEQSVSKTKNLFR